MAANELTLDPITFEVVNSSLVAICRHMANSLRRTAYSPIIHDAADFSCAIVDPEGNLVAQQEGCPIHLGTLPSSVKLALIEYGVANIHEGDILGVNDPYRGGVHLNDIGFIAPYFHEGELVAFVANRAHWPDIGGIEPSGLAGASAVELTHEGIVVPPIKFRNRGVLNSDVINLLMANVRGPEERRGDFNAQVAAMDTGLSRLPELVRKYSLPVVRACYQEALRYAERRMRQAIREIPDGVYHFEDQEDDDGILDHPIPLHVTITIQDDRLKVDYTGTGPQAKGPINSAWGMTACSTYIILKCLLDPFGPSNSGWYHLIEIEALEGTLVNPRPGAPVFGGGVEIGPRIADAIMGALSQAIPERVTAALYGTIDSSFLSGTDPATGLSYIYNDWIPGGWGGKYNADGVSCMIELCGNTDDIPIEIAELKYPLRYRRSELRRDSGGPGRFRGGLGTLREIEVLSGNARASIQADRTLTQPWGLFGGLGGAQTRYSVVRRDGAVDVVGGIRPDGTHVSAKRSFDVLEGEALRIESAGGGGYGNPKDRDRDLVQEDMRNGYISPQAARTIFALDVP
jgi:N-methylhydantoinase B